jgi:hypothetical protein
MPSKDPAILSLCGQIGGNSRAARCPDPSAHTAPARKAFRDKFENEADPDGKLDPVERARRGDMLRRAHYARMALKSAKARRAKRDARNSQDTDVA